MSSNGYKKMIIVALLFIAAGLIIFALRISNKQEVQRTRTSGPIPQRAPATGPLIDQNLQEAVPLEKLGVNTDNPVQLAALGDKYFESNKFKQAILIYQKVLELNPEDVDTYNDLGLSYQYLGQYEEAVTTLKKGIDVNPSYQRIWLTLGFTQARAGKNSEARKTLQQAFDLAPDTTIGKEAKRILGLLK